MIRTLFSLGMIVFVVAVVAAGTTAFFSDEETSVGNSFTAGALDLLIDNESYYNGNVCVDMDETEEGEDWQWQGEADYPVPGTPCSTSFELSNLDGLLFFDFNDVKPGDAGEDTISIHVQNDAWICLDLTLTANDDNSSTEPELEAGDEEENGGDAFDGELAQGIEFFWWADDGDNVYEEGEGAITDGVVSLFDLESAFPVALADSENNVWDPQNENPEPVPDNETVYIAKAWCVGDLTLDPVLDNGGVNPSVDPGVDCDGELVGNEIQTDGATLDIVFNAVQARHNDDFFCNAPETGSLTIVKEVSGGDAVPSDFTFEVNGPSGQFLGVQNGNTLTDLIPGEYTVVEEAGGPAGYTGDFSQCGDGSVDVNAGGNTLCTITNDADAGSITIDKSVSFTNASIAISVADFDLFVDDGENGTIELFDEVEMSGLPAGTYTVSESYEGSENILYNAIFTGDCTDDGDTGTIILAPGGSASCDLENEITVLEP
jgi:predicted ribosomally synthesized peptide with SipW-like signal peptide